LIFQLPYDLAGWLAISGHLATLAIALGFFLLPHRLLRRAGLGGATHEGRSSFAGFAVGTAVCALLFGQPVLDAMLGSAWAIAAAGILVSIAIDKVPASRGLLRAAACAGLSALCLQGGDFPELSYSPPRLTEEWIISVTAAITALFGAIALVFPRLALSMMRLHEAGPPPGGMGTPRGMLAGFYLAAGLAFFLSGGLFSALALGAGWLATAFGRAVAIVVDRAPLGPNLAFLAFDAALAALPLGVVFGYLG
jgi:uncharacterized membrane protein YhaH (DUF805 family)